MPVEIKMVIFALVGLLGSWYLSRGILLITWKVALRFFELFRR